MQSFYDPKTNYQFCVPRDPRNDEFIEKGIEYSDLIDWVKQYFVRSGTFIDIGAHIGTFCIPLAHRCRKVIAFEPSMYNRELLCAGVIINNLHNIDIKDVALNNHPGSAVLETICQSDSLGRECKITDATGQETPSPIPFNNEFPDIRREVVATAILDSYDIKDVCFVKINTNGHELAILQGAVDTLRNSHWPKILVKLAEESVSEVQEFVEMLGYKIVPVSGYKGHFLITDHRDAIKAPTTGVNGRLAKDLKKLADNFYKAQADLEVKPSTLVPKMVTMVGKLPKVSESYEDYADLALYFFQEDKYRQAYQCAKLGLSCFTGPADMLYHLYNILSATCYKLNNTIDDGDKSMIDEGREALNKVILAINATWEIRNDCMGDAGWYVRPLMAIRSINLDIKLSRTFNPSTPSIIRLTAEQIKSSRLGFNQGLGLKPGHLIPAGAMYRVLVRSVNYTLSNGVYTSADKNNVIRTQNWIIYLNSQLDMIPGQQLLYDHNNINFFPDQIVGMEDARLIEGTNSFFCTRVDIEDTNTPSMCWGDFGTWQTQQMVASVPLPSQAAAVVSKNAKRKAKSGAKVEAPPVSTVTSIPIPDSPPVYLAGAVTDMIRLQVGGKVQCEKNWLPFMHNGQLSFIYSFQPFVIYQAQPDGSVRQILRRRFPEYHLKEFRGSAPPIMFDGGWLLTVHNVYYVTGRHYYGRFVWFDYNFEVMKFSEMFFFEKVGVEFNAGLALGPEDKTILLTYSVNDASSKLAEVSADLVRHMLEFATAKGEVSK